MFSTLSTLTRATRRAARTALDPRGAPTDLTATNAAALLRRVRPRTAADQARRDVARDVIAEVRQVDKRLATIAASMTDALEQTVIGLTDLDCIGPVLASWLIGRIRRASRFPTNRRTPLRRMRPWRSLAAHALDTGSRVAETGS